MLVRIAVTCYVQLVTSGLIPVHGHNDTNTFVTMINCNIVLTPLFIHSKWTLFQEDHIALLEHLRA